MDRQRLFGANPLGVLIRLVLLSIVVGIVLSALGISPQNFFHQVNVLARRLYELGFKAVDWVLPYFLIGAMVVFPIWIIAWLVRAVSRRSQHGGTDGP